MKSFFLAARLAAVALLLLALLLPAGRAVGQTTPVWQSAVAVASMTNGGTSRIRATAVDAATGAVFVTGYFSGQVVFGSHVLVSMGGSDDVFVARYNPGTATWAWAQREGGGGTDYGYGIATDGLGGVYVTGNFVGSAVFAGQPALNSSSFDVFVAAYAAADGTGRWAKSGGGVGTDVGCGIAVDGQGGVYVTGWFNASGTFAGQPTLRGSNAEAFVAAYAAADGTGRWAKSGGGLGGDIGYGIAADGQGGVYVTGLFQNSGTFAGQTILNGAAQEIFVAAYAAADGTGRWAKSGGGSGYDAGVGVAADGQGGVYVTGFFSGNGVFAGQPALNGVGLEAFVAAYAAADGTGRWAKSGGGAGIDAGYSIATDGLGGLYITGFFDNNSVFAGQPALNGVGLEAFVAAYATANGTGRWVKSGGGGGTDAGYGIATDGARLYMGGFVALPAAFDAIALSGTSAEASALAILQLPPSLVRLSLTQAPAGSTLTATGGALAGATAVTFTPAGRPGTAAAAGYTSTATTVGNITVPAGLAPGTYTVTVSTPAGTSNGLPFVVGPLATLTNALAHQIILYPNPTTGRLTVRRPAGAAAAAVLLNALGQVVQTLALPTAETPVDLSGLASGVYTLRLAVGGQPVVKRLVVE